MSAMSSRILADANSGCSRRSPIMAGRLAAPPCEGRGGQTGSHAASPCLYRPARLLLDQAPALARRLPRYALLALGKAD